MAETTTYIATGTGVSVVDGKEYHFTAGVTRVGAGHPLLKVAGVFFATDDGVDYEVASVKVTPVEQATAGPGETRTVTHPRKP